MTKNLSLYLSRALPASRERVNRMRGALLRTGIERALILLADAATTFLEQIGLKWVERDSDGQFWDTVPEIWLPDMFNKIKMRRLEVSRRADIPMSPYQTILLLELQAEVLAYWESLSSSADLILDVSASSFARLPVAHLAMQLAAEGSWRDKSFWQSDIIPSSVFNIRLIGELERLLSRTYENGPATTSVIIVGRNFAPGVRRTNWIQRADSLFAEKCGFRLSDGISTSFVVTFDGELLGYFDTDDIVQQLAAAQEPHFRWRVLSDRTIEGLVGNVLTLAYSEGSWRYVDHAAMLNSLACVEPSLQDTNSLLWGLCLEMSRRKEGALILVVRDVARMLTDSVCGESELNLNTESRFVKKSGPEPDEPTLDATAEPGPIKLVLLELMRGRRVSDLHISQLVGLARIDGAVLVDDSGLLLGFGVILRAATIPAIKDEGARTSAARAASNYGLAIKVSADGPISAFHNGSQVAP